MGIITETKENVCENGRPNGNAVTSENPANVKEHKENRSRQTARDILTSCVEESTLHGLNRTCKTESHVLRRIIWFILLIGMFACYLILAAFSIHRYYQFETTTKFSLKTADSLEFPAVSICTNNLIPNSYVAHNNELRYWIKYLEMNPVSSLSEQDRTEASNVLNRHSFSTAIWNLSKFVENCDFNMDNFPCLSRFFGRMSESNGCYTFMDAYARKLMGEVRSDKPGFPFGLKVWVNAEVDDYFISTTYGTGMKVMVHPPDTFARLSEQAISLQPGVEAFISIQKQIIKNLPPPYSDVECVKDEDVHGYKYKTFDFGKYTFENCMLDCLLHEQFGKCNCAYDNCSLEVYYFCVRQKRQQYYAKCNCLYPCTQTIYKATVTSLALSTSTLLDATQSLNLSYNTPEDIHKNMIRIHVYYPSLRYQEVKQVEAYTFDELISNLGGQLGLFLGASVLTMVELLECLGALLAILCSCCRKKKQVVAINGSTRKSNEK